MKLPHWITGSLWAFGIFNTVIGLYLFTYSPRVALTIISPLIPQYTWATIFLVTGVLIFIGLYKKYFRFLYTLMVAGLFIKLMWETGLILRIQFGGTLFTAILWGMIAFWQILVVKYFRTEDHGDI